MNVNEIITNLQYQLSNGNWMDCRERTEEFLNLCVKNETRINGAWTKFTRETAIEALESGLELRNDREDWYSNCRIKPESKPDPVVELVKCSCGHSVSRISVMSASLGTSCPDCYDRMSE